MCSHFTARIVTMFTSEHDYEGKLFQKTPTAPFKSMVTIVSDVSEADFIILPHEYLYIFNEHQYLKAVDAFAAAHGKKIIVMAEGDSTMVVPMKQAIVLRTSAYRSELKDNEIITPPFIEDIGERGISVLEKSDCPTVGFAGMVGLPTVWEETKFQLKRCMQSVQIALSMRNSANLPGLHFRRQAVAILSRAKTCSTNFVMRNSFSAHAATITIDPAVLRQEYIDVLTSSHLALVVRGAGNFSLRFFEVLAMGRIPLFIDTDTPLPLESDIDYDSFMLRVSHKDIHRLPQIIEAWWHTLTPEEYISMQQKARTVFLDYLRSDVFYARLFATLPGRFG